MGWNYLSIPKLQRLHRWSLGMDKQFHPIHYNVCNYLSMLGLKLNHVSKRGHRWNNGILLLLHSATSTAVYMMTPSNENIFRVTGHSTGNSTVNGEIPAYRPVTRSFDAFFDLRLNKRLSQLSWVWWFATPSLPLWRHCNELSRRWSQNRGNNYTT